MGDELQTKLEACLREGSTDLDLHDLRIEDDGAKRVAEFLPKWCVQLLNP